MKREKEKYYFASEDDEFCYTLDHHIEEAKENGLSEITLIEAEPDFDNPEFIWCSENGTSGERSECNKRSCPDWKKGNLNVCKHRGRLYQHGKDVTIPVR